MDPLAIDFKSIIPYAIDAYTFVCGEEYRTLISKKINQTIIAFYHDVEGLRIYVHNLEECKQRELAIRFLEQTGLSVLKEKKEQYTEPLDPEEEKKLGCLIGSSKDGFSDYADRWSPLRAFHKDNHEGSNHLLKNKIKVLNYLLGKELVTEENFDSFANTEEYRALVQKVDELNKIYEPLLLEYRAFQNELLPYNKYIEEEEMRKKKILEKKKIELFEEIRPKLPPFLNELLLSKPIEEQKDILFGPYDLSSLFRIESFLPEKMEQLSSSERTLSEKFWIVFWQSEYLKKLGVKIPDEQMLQCDSNEDLNNYLNFLNEEQIKKYIPSLELMEDISSARKQKYEEALKEYYMTRKDFTDMRDLFANCSNIDNDTFEWIYEDIFKQQRVCVLSKPIYSNSEPLTLMFYTRDMGGTLFYSFMHELGHVIDHNGTSIGFENLDAIILKNPYNEEYRKYEKLNEALTDIFATEAASFLRKQGMYFIEPKEVTADTSDHNSFLMVKNLLNPLIQKFRKQVIKAQVMACREELIQYIGEVQFEGLVDVVNKVDHLVRNGLKMKLGANLEDQLVVEYYEQLKRVKQIYLDIDEYYANHFESSLEEKHSKKS